MANKNNASVSIQGNTASYSHIAAMALFGTNVPVLNRATFAKVFEDVHDNIAQVAVVPIENSTYGSIYTNYDNITQYGFSIIGEVYLKINFHLIGHKNTTITSLTDAYIHPVAMGQIREFMGENSHITFHEYEDTAGAVEMIKNQNLKNSAGAASKFAAEYYDMRILAENIHENPKNYTRFYVVAKNTLSDIHIDDSTFADDSKTTLEFVLGQEPGSLYKTLRAFADRDISLTKIESRPIINTDWEYRFYVDAAGKISDERMNNALKELKDYVSEYKVLGSYRRGVYVDT